MAEYRWPIERDGTSHEIRLQHYSSGRASISIDGDVVYSRPRKLFDTGLAYEFNRDGVEYTVRVIARPLGFQYELAVDGDVQLITDWTGTCILGGLFLLCVAIVVILGEFDNSYGTGFDGVGVLCFAVVGFSIFWMAFARWRMRVLMTMALITLYVGSYVWLSALGGYYYSQSGRFRWKGIGLAMFDIVDWHPKCVQWEPFLNSRGRHTHRATMLGWFYSPLVIADRKWAHPTQQLFDEDVLRGHD